MTEKKSFLQPILEDVEMGYETEENGDSLFSIETYKKFTGDDWFNCCKILTVLLVLVALIVMICYISFTTFKTY